MAISLKSTEQIEQMRQAGRIVHEALRRCTAACRPGVTTAEIDAQAEAVLAETGAMGLFKWYPTYKEGEGFPACTCISVNEEVVHGIPNGRTIRDGDVVSIDFGCRIDGWCGDSATTILVGNVPPSVRRLCETTEHVLRIAVENIRPGRTWSQVARLMESYATKAGYGVIRDFVGHGIGRTMHEDPKVPNFVSRDLVRNDIELKPGLVMAVEPMCSLGAERVRVLDDKWTVVTADGKPAAHYEHTIAVTEDGCEVLTDGR
jgi:methionyl aminopeptidase